MITNESFIKYCNEHNLRCKFREEQDYKIDENLSWLEKTFLKVCYEGYLETAKWLYETSIKENRKIDILINDGYVAKKSMFQNHLDILKWHYDIRPFDLYKDGNLMFRYCLLTNRLDFVKWLVSMDVDITFNDHYAFKTACEKHFINIVKWLCSINNDYSFEYTYNGKINPIIKNQFERFITDDISLIKILKKLKCKII